MLIPSNKIYSVVNFFKNELRDLYPEEEIKEFIFLSFEHFLGFSKTDLSIRENETITESELLKLNSVVKELKKHRPIQYILGNTKFYGLDILVNEHVLIPRPETEELVDLIIKNTATINNLQSSINILDIGTGSGCIAIALKKHISNALVYALDISEDALKVAKENAKRNNVDVHFICADIFNFPTSKLSNFPTHFNLIVSNPPYVTHSEKATMHKNVIEHEPHQALFVNDESPLLFYETIANFSLKNLTKSGKLFFEINEKYGKELVELLEQKSFTNILLEKDINIKNRILSCSYSEV